MWYVGISLSARLENCQIMCPLQKENNVLSALKSGTEKYLKSSLGQREKYVLVKLYNLICSNQLLLQFINFNKFSTATNICFSHPVWLEMMTLHMKKSLN